MLKRRLATIGISAVFMAAPLAGCQTADMRASGNTPLAPGAHYVSMGSSFAAGPGVTETVDLLPNRCVRSTDNYAQQLARSLNLSLTDVACSGATTEHILGRWDELPAQIDAATSDTRLVTITIGGNDVSFVRNMIAFACVADERSAANAPGGKCPAVSAPTEADWQHLESNLSHITAKIRERAPGAKLVFVQYVRIAPEIACAAVPLEKADLALMKQIQRRLVETTAAATIKGGAAVIDPSNFDQDHSPCSTTPWSTGFPAPGGTPFVPFHPNLEGMTAISKALAATLKRD